jgi:hypothetical protein
MFVIMGTKERNKETGHGQFFCPSCKTTRHYIQYEAAQYFSLYFIPLFKLGAARTYIQCQYCHNMFSVDLLLANPAKLALSTLVGDMEKEVKTGTPSHIIYRKLLAKNVSEPTAKAVSIAILGLKPKICITCGSLYHEQVSVCANCGGDLVENRDAAFLEEKQVADRLYWENQK